MISKTQKVPDFIAKLYDILSETDHKDIIQWDQTEFVIKNPEALAAEVLPKYYRHSKLESFIRQLNLYGFRKISKQTNKDFLYFKNDTFRQGAPELLNKIQLKSKSKKKIQGQEVQDIKELTKQRNEELMIIRQTFKSTMQTIYHQIQSMGAYNQRFEHQVRESIFLLKLCGVKQSPFPPSSEHVFPQQSVSNFLTKFNFDF